MRIISGTFRGKNIIAPVDLPVRPTTDFAKTGLLNVLNNNYDFPEADVLDLFAGTGNITYEFISRRCKSVIAVDSNRKCTRFIETTIERLNTNSSFTVYRSDAAEFLFNTPQTFDIIFADPPYDLDVAKHIHKIIFERKLLNANGVFVFEHKASVDYSVLEGFSDKRKYGNVAFSFFN